MFEAQLAKLFVDLHDVQNPSEDENKLRDELVAVANQLQGAGAMPFTAGRLREVLGTIIDSQTGAGGGRRPCSRPDCPYKPKKP